MRFRRTILAASHHLWRGHLSCLPRGSVGMDATAFFARPLSLSSPSPNIPNSSPLSGPVTTTRGEKEALAVFSHGKPFTENNASNWLRTPQRSNSSSKSTSRVLTITRAAKVATLDRKGQKERKGSRFSSGNHGRLPIAFPYRRGPPESKVVKGNPTRARKLSTTVIATRADDGDDELVSERSRGGKGSTRIPAPGPSSNWVLYAAGTAAVAAAVLASHGIRTSIAHASAQHGGENGPQHPTGSGSGGGGRGSGGWGRGGGGGDGNGGFGPGDAGESLVGNVQEEDSERQQNVENVLLPMSVSIGKKVPKRPSAMHKDEDPNEMHNLGRRRVRSLASLSNAQTAEGPVGGGDSSIGGGGMRMSRGGGNPDADQMKSSSGEGMESYAARPLYGGGPREERTRSNYNLPDPLIPRVGGGPSASGGVAEGATEESLGRDGFAPVRRSDTFNPSMQSPSSRNLPSHQQQQTHTNYNHHQFSETRKDSREPDPRFFTSHGGRGGGLPEVPPEFSSIRGKITEIPGYGHEGRGKVQDHQHPQPANTRDSSGWFGALVNSIMGKRTMASEDGTGAQRSIDEDGRKALVTEVAARTLQIITDQANETGLAKSSETGALRRLQRETFSDLLRVRERLDKLEHLTGMRRGSSGYSGDGLAGAKTTLKGEVNSGGAFVLLEDLTSNLARFALQHAELLTGLNVRFTFETRMRENDVLTTQCGVSRGYGEGDGNILGGPLSLQKINYIAQINDILSVAVSPLGAKAHDMAETVSHLQDQALTTFAGSGPALYKHCRGSAIGASLRSNSALLSVGQFLSGWGSRAADATSGPLCLSTLAQLMVQPCEHVVFSVSGVSNSWPSPPLPSSSGLHWSELGPLVFCKTVTRPTQPTGTFTFSDLPPSRSTSFLSQVNLPERDSWSPDAESRAPPGSSGTATQSLALSGEVDLGGHVSLGGWAQVERANWLEELEKRDFQWNLSLAKSTGSNVDWGLSVGCRKREDWGEDGSASPNSGPLEPPSTQMQMEAFVKLKAGRGFAIQPGLVYIVDKDTQTPAFMLRSSWNL